MQFYQFQILNGKGLSSRDTTIYWKGDLWPQNDNTWKTIVVPPMHSSIQLNFLVKLNYPPIYYIFHIFSTARCLWIKKYTRRRKSNCYGASSGHRWFATVWNHACYKATTTSEDHPQNTRNNCWGRRQGNRRKPEIRQSSSSCEAFLNGDTSVTRLPTLCCRGKHFLNNRKKNYVFFFLLIKIEENLM